VRVAALEDFGVGAVGGRIGFGLEVVVLELVGINRERAGWAGEGLYLVEVTFEGEIVFGPDAFEGLDEFIAASTKSQARLVVFMWIGNLPVAFAVI